MGGPKIGLMFVIATNVSSWLINVVDEALHMIHVNGGDDAHHRRKRADSTDTSCTCYTDTCKTVQTAQMFLFPFVVEFSVISAFLLFIIWENVGKTVPPSENVTRPSYNLLKSFVGIVVGLLFLGATIAIMIVLSNEATSESYLHDAIFMTVVETMMIVGCCFGFYLFMKIPTEREPPLMLDIVLLVLCVIGPVLLDLFTLFAVINGNEDKVIDKGVTVMAPLWDIIQCILQLAFIIAGLQREPRRSEEAKKTVEDIRKRIEDELSKRGIGQNEESAHHEGHHGEEENYKYITMNRYSVKNIVSKLTNGKSLRYVKEKDDGALNPSFDGDENANAKEEVSKKKSLDQLNAEWSIESDNVSKPKTIRFNEEEESSSSDSSDSDKEEEVRKRKPTVYRRNNISVMASNQRSCRRTTHRRRLDYPPPIAQENNSSVIVRIVSETDLEQPDKKRLMLRNMVLALLIANACLWLYLSLGGTAYSLDYYQSHYYGATVWTTILMICRPLSIFYRMHSAGCLFEMWSYA